MKIQIIASFANTELLHDVYPIIEKTIKDLGHEVLTLYSPMPSTKEDILSWDKNKHLEYFKKWVKLREQTDIAVIESSFPGSTNVGASIASFIENGIPTINLYRADRPSVMMNDYFSSKLIGARYTDASEVEYVLKYAIEKATLQLERRFTMFISGNIDAHLTKVVKKLNISRSEYIRGLILKDIHT